MATVLGLPNWEQHGIPRTGDLDLLRRTWGFWPEEKLNVFLEATNAVLQPYWLIKEMEPEFDFARNDDPDGAGFPLRLDHDTAAAVRRAMNDKFLSLYTGHPKAAPFFAGVTLNHISYGLFDNGKRFAREHVAGYEDALRNLVISLGKIIDAIDYALDTTLAMSGSQTRKLPTPESRKFLVSRAERRRRFLRDRRDQVAEERRILRRKIPALKRNMRHWMARTAN